jgi:probable HAF family extracellular repeat protein
MVQLGRGVAGLAVIVALAVPARAAICKYKIEVLQPSMAGYDWCFATALSDKGHVVGTCLQEFGEETRAFLHALGVTTSIGVLPSFNQGRGNGVNNHGEVVGSSGLSFDPWPVDAHLWRNGGPLENLEMWASFPMLDTIATDVNDAGEIVGTDDYNQAVYWLAGQDPIYLASYSSRANAINNAGQIGGVGPDGHAARWDNLAIVDLGILPGGGFAEVHDIAENGFVAGWGNSSIPPAPGFRGFFHDASSTPGLKMIGTFGGSSSMAFGVSSDGQVVGNATDATGAGRGFVWRKDKLHDLNDLLDSNPPADPWFVHGAVDINENGQILVSASNRVTAAYLLLHPRSCTLASSLACCPF